jgi:hypothetical protein
MLQSYLARKQGATTLAHINRDSLQTHEILNEVKKILLSSPRKETHSLEE